MDFPPHSPDLNRIKQVGGHLKTERAIHSVTSQQALGNTVKSCWDKSQSVIIWRVGNETQKNQPKS